MEKNISEEYYANERDDIQKIITGTPKRILDVGCGSGKLASILKKKYDAEVWGIEIISDAAKNAEQVLDKVFNLPVEEAILELPDNYFDTIIFADVLEHLVDPYSVLKVIKTKFSDTGSLVVSLPNVRYWRVIKSLLEGSWRYADAGILDRTHLRFFTKESIFEMLEDAGYSLADMWSKKVETESVPQNVIDALFAAGLKVDTLAEDATHFQYVIKAKPHFVDIKIVKEVEKAIEILSEFLNNNELSDALAIAEQIVDIAEQNKQLKQVIDLADIYKCAAMLHHQKGNFVKSDYYLDLLNKT